MTIAKIEGGVVQQVDRTTDTPPTGWVVAPDNVVCGMVDNGDGTFSNPVKSPADAATKKRLEINRWRLEANFSTFPYSGKQIACDALSRSDIDGVNGYVATNGALPPGFPDAWKATDNTYVSITDVATWNSFYSEMVSTGATNFSHSQDLKGQIDTILSDDVTYPTDADKVAAIEAISW